MQSERTTGKGNCKIMCFKIDYRSIALFHCDLKLIKDSQMIKLSTVYKSHIQLCTFSSQSMYFLKRNTYFSSHEVDNTNWCKFAGRCSEIG